MKFFDKAGKAFVESLMDKMTLREKIGQLNQISASKREYKEKDLRLIREGKIGSILNAGLTEDINEFQRVAKEESRLGIPILIGQDVIHGHRTIFPVPIAASCAWDLDMVEKGAHIAAKEANATGIRWTFAPMVDVSREQRWGRVMEGAGEDAWYGSQVARAAVRGFQMEDGEGRPLLAACAKHFAGYGFSEGGRDYSYTEISKQTMREYVLPPFKAAVDEGVATIMSAFNDISGVPASGNKWTCDDVLRGEWGFKGFVVSDWASVGELVNHGYAENDAEAALRGLTAGVDMDMHSGVYLEYAEQLVNEGKMSVEVIDRAVYRILSVKYWLGLFDNPYTDPCKQMSLHLCDEHRTAARNAARKTFVLLKNEDSLLPITKEKVKKIALIGPLMKNSWGLLGGWHDWGKIEEMSEVYTALSERAAAEGIEVTYSQGNEYHEKEQDSFEEAAQLAAEADVAIVLAGEGGDKSAENNNRSFIGMLPQQLELLKKIHSTGTPVILLLTNGRAMALSWEAENIPAILDVWLPGTEAGNAIADVVFGDYNPAGKLTVTFPRTGGQVPIYYNQRKSGRIFMHKYLDEEAAPLYPFGYGLSYTTFEYGNVNMFLDGELITPDDIKEISYMDKEYTKEEISRRYGDFCPNRKQYRIMGCKEAEVAVKTEDLLNKTRNLYISAEITNAGDVGGEETAQLYISDIAAKITRPIKELKGYEKVYLKPGETVTVRFDITYDLLGYIAEDGTYTVEPGRFSVAIGKNSAEYNEISFVLE